MKYLTLQLTIDEIYIYSKMGRILRSNIEVKTTPKQAELFKKLTEHYKHLNDFMQICLRDIYIDIVFMVNPLVQVMTILTRHYSDSCVLWIRQIGHHDEYLRIPLFGYDLIKIYDDIKSIISEIDFFININKNNIKRLAVMRVNLDRISPTMCLSRLMRRIKWNKCHMHVADYISKNKSKISIAKSIVIDKKTNPCTIMYICVVTMSNICYPIKIDYDDDKNMFIVNILQNSRKFSDHKDIGPYISEICFNQKN